MYKVGIAIINPSKEGVYPIVANMIDSNALLEKPWMIRAVRRVW
jgi:hypothetical protein